MADPTLIEELSEYLQKKYFEMKDANYPFILFDTVSKEHEEIILSLIQKTSNVKAFLIGNMLPQIVLCLNHNNSESNEKLVYESYYNNDYEECINQAKRVITSSPNISKKYYLFLMMGKAYFKLGNKPNAYKCFQICDGILERLGLQSKLPLIYDELESDPDLIDKLDLSYIAPIELHKLIEQKSKDVLSRVAIILPEEYSSSAIKPIIFSIVKTYSNIIAFSMPSIDGERVVIMHKRRKNGINYKALEKKVNIGLDPLEEIKIVNELIRGTANPKNSNLAYYFKILGYDYLKINQFELALEYFILADGINKKNNGSKDFTRIIESLRKKIAILQIIERYNIKTKFKKGKVAVHIEDIDITREVRGEIFDITNRLGNVQPLIIGSPRLSLYLKPYITIDEDKWKELYSEAFSLYKENDYEQAEIKIKEAIIHSKGINSLANLYQLLGQTELKLGRKIKGQYYLNIAIGLYELLNSELSRIKISRLLALTDAEVDDEDFKPEVVMSEEEFDYPIEEIAFEDIKYIADLIPGSGKSVHEICKEKAYNAETENLINLYLAVKCYKNKQYDFGDIYYKEVENSSFKSETIKKLLQVIKSKKKFYHNREDSRNTPITIKPI